MLVPSIAEQSEDFTDDDASNGLAYVFTNLFAICIAAFCVAGPLLELPKSDVAKPSECESGDFSSPTPLPPAAASADALNGTRDQEDIHRSREEVRSLATLAFLIM